VNIRTLRFRLVHVVALGLVPLALSACGASSTTGPPVGQTLAQALMATANAGHSVKYDLTVDISGQTGASASPALAKFFAHPSSFDISGGLSKDALTATLNASAGGKTSTDEVEVSQHDLYLLVHKQWYADNKGMGSLSAKAANATSGTSVERAAADVSEFASQVVTGTEVPGPDENGATWEFDGKLNVAGFEELTAVRGKPMSAADQKAFGLIAPLLTVEVVTGRADHVLRDIGFTLKADRSQVAALDAAEGKAARSASGVKAIDITVSLSLSGWNQPVTVKPPVSYQPFARLLQGGLLTELSNGLSKVRTSSLTTN
jgi:hypothetical protein